MPFLIFIRLPKASSNAGISWEELLQILEWDKNDLADNSR